MNIIVRLVKMADIQPAAAVLVGTDTPAGSSRLSRLLHRGKGQFENTEANELDVKGQVVSSDASSESSVDERVLKGFGDAFEQGEFVESYAPIDTYEGRHRYDPRVSSSRMCQAQSFNRPDRLGNESWSYTDRL